MTLWPRLVVFASGTPTGGGSGFENLVINSRELEAYSGPPILQAKIVCVVSNHAEGGVAERARRLGVEFIHFPKPWTAEVYQHIVAEHQATFTALSGWLKPVVGLDPRTTFNIHKGPLPQFGGKGMWGHHVDEAVMQAYHAGAVTHSEVTMHFATEKYDAGPVFFRYPVAIQPHDTPETLGTKVNKAEHYWQPRVTDAVLRGDIRWDGKDPASLVTVSLDYFK